MPRGRVPACILIFVFSQGAMFGDGGAVCPRYSTLVGDGASYSVVVTTTTLATDASHNGPTVDRVDYVLKETVTAFERGIITMTTTVRRARHTIDGKWACILMGPLTPLRMHPNGTPVDGAHDDNMASICFPDKPLRPGDAWTTEYPVMCGSTQRQAIRWRVLERKKWKGRDCLVIGSTYGFATKVAGDTSGDVAFEAHGLGVSYFDVNAGWLVGHYWSTRLKLDRAAAQSNVSAHIPLEISCAGSQLIQK